VYNSSDKEAFKLAKRFRDILNLQDRKASGEVLDKNQQAKVAAQSDVATTLLCELGSLPSASFKKVATHCIAGALLLELESSPLDIMSSERIQDLRFRLTEAIGERAQEKLETKGVEQYKSTEISCEPESGYFARSGKYLHGKLTVSAADLASPSLNHVTDKSSDVEGQEPAVATVNTGCPQFNGAGESTSQGHRRSRPRAGRSHFKRRYDADH
jgi:hypothetical protein